MAVEGIVYFVQQQITTVGEPDADDLLKTLADDRRRRTLRILWDADGAVSLADLADEITRRERASVSETPSDSKGVQTALYHVHLPKLADAGLVTVADDDEWTRLIFTAAPETKELLSDLLAIEEA